MCQTLSEVAFGESEMEVEQAVSRPISDTVSGEYPFNRPYENVYVLDFS